MSEYVQLIKDIAAIASLTLSILIFCINVILLKRKQKIQKENQEGQADEQAKEAEETTILARALNATLFVKNAVDKLVVEAEDFINYSGSDKKAWVVTKVKELCIDSDIEYTEDLITNAIEAVINITKRVNAPAQKLEQVAQEDKEASEC